LNLSETVTDFVFKTVKLVLKHSEEIGKTFELFRIVFTASRWLTILQHLNALLQPLLKDLDAGDKITEFSLDVLFQFGLVSLNFEADARK